jgi:Acyl-coenzyme A synthetases/AMP-(fatty) acid ligases
MEIYALNILGLVRCELFMVIMRDFFRHISVHIKGYILPETDVGGTMTGITGSQDALMDVLNVSGHRMGTAELESALVLHENVAEAAVVGFPHEIKGQGIYAFVTLNTGVDPTDELQKELIRLVRKEIGPIASFDVVQWAPGLPKTRSGKIMRRILRKIAESDTESIGDVSTLADPSVVDDLISNRPAN